MIKESRKTSGWILLFSFLVSLFTLIVYILETSLADKELFLLLAIMRYSSFTVFVSSMFFFITGIISLVKKFSVILILQVFFSFLGVFYGAGIIVADAFISTITNG
jgi:hypothetical protein